MKYILSLAVVSLLAGISNKASAESFNADVDQSRPVQEIKFTITYDQKTIGPDLKSDLFNNIRLVSSAPMYGQTQFSFSRVGIDSSDGDQADLVCKKLGYRKGHDDGLTSGEVTVIEVHTQLDKNLKVSFLAGGTHYKDIACLK